MTGGATVTGLIHRGDRAPSLLVLIRVHARHDGTCSQRLVWVEHVCELLIRVGRIYKTQRTSLWGGPSFPLIMMAPADERSIWAKASGVDVAMREDESCEAARVGT